MEALQKSLKTAAKTVFHLEVEPTVSRPDSQFGDFSTNLALQIAPQVKQLPLDIAQRLAKQLQSPQIAKIDVAGPGFINLTMSDAFWIDQATRITSTFGHSTSGKGQKVQVEFISANPTGPLTLANGRGGYGGDVLAHVLQTAGYQVQREYYINDAGNQIKELVNSVRGRGNQATADKAGGYSGSYITEIADALGGTLTSSDDDTLADTVVSHLLERSIKPSVERMGITFDNWFSEKNYLYKDASAPIHAVLKRLQAANMVQVKEGAQWLKGDDPNARERVLVKSDGSFTYLLADLAYHWDKFETRGFDKVINLWGADHAGQVQSLKDGVKALGIGKPLDIIIFQLVRLIRGGKEFKMSKRAGTFVTIDDLLQEIDPDVARWFFLMRDFNTHMDFDLDLAKEQSAKNPFYYVMYAYTRAHSILEKAAAKGLEPSEAPRQLSSAERRLLRTVSRWPELIQQIAHSYEVHKLTFYGLELAKDFHDYYEQDRIIGLPPDQAGPKLYLLQQIIVVFENFWRVLGISPRQQM